MLFVLIDLVLTGHLWIKIYHGKRRENKVDLSEKENMRDINENNIRLNENLILKNCRLGVFR